jgi:uncharacterized membrane protein
MAARTFFRKSERTWGPSLALVRANEDACPTRSSDDTLRSGTLILLFGMRWLRKAILRSAGVIPLDDEQAAYVKETALLRGIGGNSGGWDWVAVSAAFKITMNEGIEVVFIVVAVGDALASQRTVGPGILIVSICTGALMIITMPIQYRMLRR